MMKGKTKILRWASMFLIAWMLGLSNVLNEETRMIQDSFDKIEVVEEIPDDEPL